MEFGQRLLTLRKGEGLSQEQLGVKINVSRQTISKWELGESSPEMDKLILLSNCFKISLDELVKGEVKQVSHEPNHTLSQKIDNSNFYIKLLLKCLAIIAVICIGFVFLVQIFYSLTLL